MKKKVISALLCAALATAFCTGCGSSGGQGESQTAKENVETAQVKTQGASEDVLKVRVGAQPTSGQVFQFVADDQGFNEEEGVEVEMVWLSNLSDAAAALMADQVDVLSTYGTGGPLIQVANGQDFNLFGGYMIIGETPVFAKPETVFEDLDSLKGKTIGITRGGTPDIVLKGILYDAGIPFKYLLETSGGTADFGNLKICLENLTVAAAGDVWEVKGILSFEVAVFQRGKEEMIREIELCEPDAEKYKRTPGMVGYVVKSGDSLWDIGKRYMVSLDNLKEMNHLTKDEVCAGEKILIIR